jgi:hypothetical protein
VTRSSVGKKILAVTSGLALLLWFGSPLFADNGEITRLRLKVAELEHKVQKLESMPRDREDSSTEWNKPDHGWQNKKNWRLLKLGMTEDQVEKILGNPVKHIQGVRTLWYYPSIYCGYVSFDENGRLAGWNEP